MYSIVLIVTGHQKMMRSAGLNTDNTHELQLLRERESPFIDKFLITRWEQTSSGRNLQLVLELEAVEVVVVEAVEAADKLLNAVSLFWLDHQFVCLQFRTYRLENLRKTQYCSILSSCWHSEFLLNKTYEYNFIKIKSMNLKWNMYLVNFTSSNAGNGYHLVIGCIQMI